MKRGPTNWSRHISLVFLVLMVIACERTQSSSFIDQSKNMKSFGKMTQRCVGRYIVELPEEFVLNSQGGQIIDGVTINVKAATREAFESHLASRTTKLESTMKLGPKQDYPMLRRTIPLINGAKGVVFDRAKSDVAGGRLSRTLELLGWRDGYTITGTIEATDTTFPEDANNLVVREQLKTDVAEKLAKLMSVFARTKGRANDSVPQEQGVCIRNGLVSGPPSSEEEVTIFYHLTSAEDVFFRINTSSLDAEDDTVLDRVARIQPLLAESKGRILRKGARDTNGLKANEIAYVMLGDEDLERRRIMVYKYIFEANSKNGSAKDPIITIDLLNGERKPAPVESEVEPSAALETATLSETDVAALWDSVIPTVRKHLIAF